MSEEEKKAVEHLNSFLNIPEFVWIKESELLMINVKIVLNLIEKQQKELNNIKEIEKSHQEENGKLRVEFEKVYEDNLTLAKELEQEKEKNKELETHLKQYLDGELITAKQGKFFEKMIKENYISKDKIRKFIKEELPEEEICNTCEIYDVNGIDIKEKIEKILAES